MPCAQRRGHLTIATAEKKGFDSNELATNHRRGRMETKFLPLLFHRPLQIVCLKRTRRTTRESYRYAQIGGKARAQGTDIISKKLTWGKFFGND